MQSWLWLAVVLVSLLTHAWCHDEQADDAITGGHQPAP
jgi:hypothetical protein